MKIGLISDNHSYDGHDIKENLKDCDEVWHAGDIGSLESIAWIKDICPVRAVYGNIDVQDVRAEYPEENVFEVEGLKVYMIHIGGYPGRMLGRVRKRLLEEKPDLYICGHSHILKVMRDHELGILHMNPGAYGHHGFHKIRTILTFEIHDGNISNLNAVELGVRGHVEGLTHDSPL